VLSPTPRNILLGVSREVVREISVRLGIPFVERDLQVHDAVTADEILVATTPYCIAPATRINGLAVPVGPVFQRIIAAWSADVGLDIREQFLAADLPCDHGT
jgi:branched-subunit amino acid aminotransferase/4-amino-4-deoxychorismate lyase